MQGVSRRSLSEAKERLGGLLASDRRNGSTLGEELFEILHLLDANPPLRRALSDGSLPAEQKTGLVRSLLGGQVGDQALEIVDGLVSPAWSRSNDLTDALEQLAVIALVDRVDHDGQLDDLEDELFRFSRIIEGNAGLRTAVTDRTAPADSKSALLERLLRTKVTAGTLRLVEEVAAHPRGRSFAHGLETYAELAADYRRSVIAVVRTAKPLSDDQRDRLVRALTATYGRNVHLNIEIDPTVVGGLSVQIGDELIDGTVRRRLDEAHRRFVA
jgi:F-type H+-transporting ATPase subunit delta